MNATSTRPAAREPEWFATWFDSPHYHRLYAHRDEREAAGFIDRLIDRLQPAPGAAVLDLGCGAGRHARRLAARGFDVTGIDLSAESIREGERSRTGNLRFHRQDIRTAFGDARFDCVFSLFTSFGYFDDPADDLKVVRNIARALKPGGILVLDYLNVGYAEARLQPDETVERDGVQYEITRWSDARHIHKRILVHDGSRAPLAFAERVARLTLDGFRFLFALYGLRLEEVFGSYQLHAFDPAESERLILVARAAGGDAARELPAREIAPDAADRLRRHAQV
jgi:SAM-dependent methyltransferase